MSYPPCGCVVAVVLAKERTPKQRLAILEKFIDRGQQNGWDNGAFHAFAHPPFIYNVYQAEEARALVQGKSSIVVPCLCDLRKYDFTADMKWFSIENRRPTNIKRPAAEQRQRPSDAADKLRQKFEVQFGVGSLIALKATEFSGVIRDSSRPAAAFFVNKYVLGLPPFLCDELLRRLRQGELNMIALVEDASPVKYVGRFPPALPENIPALIAKKAGVESFKTYYTQYKAGLTEARKAKEAKEAAREQAAKRKRETTPEETRYWREQFKQAVSDRVKAAEKHGEKADLSAVEQAVRKEFEEEYDEEAKRKEEEFREKRRKHTGLYGLPY